ncbi:unnamed protein product [Adineta steineri]|uniref:Uncharacterized protein n=1 Tax=Adineta steineri TaxID=433720 RepID=A0A819DXN4_9BILA|nr:unnamed protein product [Adineta steineri]CAF1423547.1 unnamed protein product [Adineta steineri]CAF3830243.1 unnamed protein product [Adineta steineri]CAF3840809.1 unnamed protein product [Adineta steineri]
MTRKSNIQLVFYGLVSCINSNTTEFIDTTLLTSESSSIVSTSSSSIPSHNTTTYHPRYEDTFSPGSVVGLIMGSVAFISVMSLGAYYIRRPRINYLPYYNNNNDSTV